MTQWIDARDRGLQYGDGLFETMRIRGRSIRFLDYHLDRLRDGCGRLEIRLPDGKRLRRELLAAAAAAGRRDAVLKLIVTRGIGRHRGYRPSGRERSTRVITVHSLARKTLVAARVRLCRTRLSENEALAGLKTLNRLDAVLARAEWSTPAIWEGLMRDRDDHIVCGTMTNLFVRRGSRLLTPVLDRCGIAGVMRRWVLEQAVSIRVRAAECRLRWSDLDSADEMFLTNAVAGIVPVVAVQDGRARIVLRSGGAAAELRRRLAAE